MKEGEEMRKSGLLIAILSLSVFLCFCGKREAKDKSAEEENRFSGTTFYEEKTMAEDLSYSSLLLGGIEFKIPSCFGIMNESKSTDTNKYYYAEKVEAPPMLMISYNQLDSSQEEFNVKKGILIESFFGSFENVKIKDTKDVSVEGLSGITAAAAGSLSGMQMDIWVTFIYNMYEHKSIVIAFSQLPDTEYDYITPYESIIQNAVLKSERVMPEEAASEPLELVESGYAVKNGYDKFYIQYAIIVRNPNAEKGVRFPKVRITAKNANNEILGTSDIVGKEILPNGMWYSAFQACSTEEEPASVDFELIQPEDSEWVSSSHFDYVGEELLVENPVKRNDKIVGEISNPNDYDIDGVAVTVLFRDESGKLLAGETTYTDKITANGKIPFELLYFGGEHQAYITDHFEVHASPWY